MSKSTDNQDPLFDFGGEFDSPDQPDLKRGEIALEAAINSREIRRLRVQIAQVNERLDAILTVMQGQHKAQNYLAKAMGAMARGGKPKPAPAPELKPEELFRKACDIIFDPGAVGSLEHHYNRNNLAGMVETIKRHPQITEYERSKILTP